MNAINDPLGQNHSPASSDHYSQLKVVFLRDFKKWRRTEDMCEKNDPYRP